MKLVPWGGREVPLGDLNQNRRAVPTREDLGLGGSHPHPQRSQAFGSQAGDTHPHSADFQ